jgi:hypothetical protein
LQADRKIEHEALDMEAFGCAFEGQSGEFAALETVCCAAAEAARLLFVGWGDARLDPSR